MWKKFFLMLMILLFLLDIKCTASDEIQRLFDTRITTLKELQEEVLNGSIPVYFYIACEDTSLSNKLNSLLASKLRKKDNIKIVSYRYKAWLWIRLLAIKVNRNQIVVSAAFGRDVDCVLEPYEERVKISNLYPQDLLIDDALSLYVSNMESLGQLLSEVVNSFEVKAVEPVRRKRDSYYSDKAEIEKLLGEINSPKIKIEIID